MVAVTTSPVSPSPHSPPPTPHSRPTPLSPLDRALLDRLYAQSTTELSELLASLDKEPIDHAPRTLFELTLWACSDEVRPWIEVREAQLNAPLRRRHLANLDTLALESPNPAERRRASTTILRILSAPGGTLPHGGTASHGGTPLRGVRNPPSSPKAQRTAPRINATCFHSDPLPPPEPHTREPHPSPAHPLTPSPVPSPPHSPNPTRSPQDLIDLILLAIREPDNPEPNTGPLTLFTLAGRTNPADLPDYSSNFLANVLPNCWQFRHASQHPLTLRTAAELHAAYPHLSTLYDSATAIIDLTLHDHSTRTLQVELRRPQSGPHKDCWLLQHLSAFTPASTNPLHNTS